MQEKMKFFRVRGKKRSLVMRLPFRLVARMLCIIRIGSWLRVATADATAAKRARAISLLAKMRAMCTIYIVLTDRGVVTGWSRF